jgi:TATA-box binding protein (TBP) (component of TFIID and TFIIIB)
MIYISIILIFALCFAILVLTANANKDKKAFKEKIKFLENIIFDLNQNLTNQTQKIKLLDDLKLNLNQSNIIIGNQIADLNYQMFDELYKRK